MGSTAFDLWGSSDKLPLVLKLQRGREKSTYGTLFWHAFPFPGGSALRRALKRQGDIIGRLSITGRRGQAPNRPISPASFVMPPLAAGMHRANWSPARSTTRLRVCTRLHELSSAAHWARVVVASRTRATLKGVMKRCPDGTSRTFSEVWPKCTGSDRH